jgi:hypothetical protein
MRENIRLLVFWDWLTSLRMMFSSSILYVQMIRFHSSSWLSSIPFRPVIYIMHRELRVTLSISHGNWVGVMVVWIEIDAMIIKKMALEWAPGIMR